MVKEGALPLFVFYRVVQKTDIQFYCWDN